MQNTEIKSPGLNREELRYYKRDPEEPQDKWIVVAMNSTRHVKESINEKLRVQNA